MRMIIHGECSANPAIRMHLQCLRYCYSLITNGKVPESAGMVRQQEKFYT